MVSVCDSHLGVVGSIPAWAIIVCLATTLITINNFKSENNVYVLFSQNDSSFVIQLT